ncbi:poly-gamma-glutamate biosynthesis protein PgsC [Luteibaculum oceani]|uniref:Poly-gamma-glutamate biosynthesis protein PgsC n=1 Tax=Luteibaculum oceani TaxID=1294296 RepID=A0A5C6UVG3_9FLAO|nr:poly-gamma-glutamate biosynthesis protein PgsC [Luteibaculum oceani]TXC76116.1 poly-gamma-glutamate biosynthesis protein PgsC [Luteibaculum oceani]
MIELAVTIGIALSLFFLESFGMAAGGIIVPGYVALQLGTPDRLVGLVLVALITFFVLKLIGKFTFLFGRRQMVIALLVGTIFSMVSHHFMFINGQNTTLEFSAVGWVVPGLVAHWSLKQGFVKTISMLIIISSIARLLVILCMGGEIIPNLY